MHSSSSQVAIFLNRSNYLGLVAFFFLGLLSQSVQAVTLKFCYQDQPLAPYYFGSGHQVPAIWPGATVEHIQQLVAKVPNLQLELVRYPWNRCLKYLQAGLVYAVVANYSENREMLGVFPKRDGKPDQSKMFTRQDVCLVTDKELATKWNGRFFEVDRKVTATRQTPRVKLSPETEAKLNFVQASADANSLKMLAQGRVQVVTQVCKIMEQKVTATSFNPQTMVVLTPPVDQLHGYLLFSRQFYQKQPEIAEQLWQKLADPQLAIYQKYLE